jgi:hypothetical protein
MRAAYDNPAVVAQMAAALAAQQAATANRWDDGSHGNRHDDFDAPDEGFVDRDGDGIGEARLSIPDSGATDNLPLTTEALAATLTAE